ncbi:aminoacyl-tRNA hydrolase [bacterium]|nr:MAG: aminoacyl-tRNA hydrolase [bacterium]
MKLIFGLGNPGPKYENTRHNLGFRVLDALAQDLGLAFESQKLFQSEIAKNQNVILAKPQTFMNESGKAVQKLLAGFKLQPNAVLVVHDDIDLLFGAMKLPSGSGSAGHRGVGSVIAITTPEVSRLRIGIEHRAETRIPPTEDYVLQDFTKEEEMEIKNVIIPQALIEIKKFCV